MTGLANIVGQGFLMNWYYWKRVGLNIPRFWKNILNIEEMPLALCILFLILGQFVDFYNIYVFLMGVVVYVILYVILIWNFSMEPNEKQMIAEIFNIIKKKRK